MFLQQERISLINKKRNSFFNRIMNNFYFPWKKIKKSFSSRELIVGILITEKCNLNCVYCYEKYKTNKNIT